MVTNGDQKDLIGRRPARAKSPRKQGGGRAKRDACQELFHRCSAEKNDAALKLGGLPKNRT
jgi:hypothetical protein